jgi:hypothetical protein
MAQGTAKDWQIISSHFLPYASALPDRILSHLRLLDRRPADSGSSSSAG